MLLSQHCHISCDVINCLLKGEKMEITSPEYERACFILKGRCYFACTIGIHVRMLKTTTALRFILLSMRLNNGAKIKQVWLVRWYDLWYEEPFLTYTMQTDFKVVLRFGQYR
jgi:hypothetical protein